MSLPFSLVSGLCFQAKHNWSGRHCQWDSFFSLSLSLFPSFFEQTFPQEYKSSLSLFSYFFFCVSSSVSFNSNVSPLPVDHQRVKDEIREGKRGRDRGKCPFRLCVCAWVLYKKAIQNSRLKWMLSGHWKQCFFHNKHIENVAFSFILSRSLSLSLLIWLVLLCYVVSYNVGWLEGETTRRECFALFCWLWVLTEKPDVW